MTVKRRKFLYFMLGATAGSVMLEKKSLYDTKSLSLIPRATANTGPNLKGLNFKPVKLPMPLELDDMTEAEQIAAYSTYSVIDDLVLPEGYTYQIIGMWGDQVGDSRFGYNNDYLAWIETAPNEGLLTINFEYISGKTWMETYPEVIKKNLPFAQVKTAAAANEGKINTLALAQGDQLKSQIEAIAKEAMIDQGIGIISLRRNPEGKWERTFSQSDRRITGISGLEDGRYLQATGPGVGIFEKKNKKGYEDGLGSKIIGTLQNCAGGKTPWGTVLSAEENFQDQVPEPVMADGSSLDPAKTPFLITDEELDGRGNVFGLAGNKYGWMVEVDPANPNDYGTKHTWLGRFRHEAVAVRAEAGKKLGVYSGCDRRGGHLYKFISQAKVTNIQDKANSQLLTAGMLYGAKFYPDGTGEWIPLKPETPVKPVKPLQVEGNMVPLPNPNRAEGGIVEISNDSEISEFALKFQTLGDLYIGSEAEKQGAILIDAHFAANAAGVTCTARPEDTEVAADGTLYIAYTSGTPGGDGGPDKQIFLGPKGESPYEFGWIMKLVEENQDPEAMKFRWEMLALGGEPAAGGLGFSNPDNLEIDNNGNVWMVTDISTSSHNKAVPVREEQGKPVSQKDLIGIFGNNSAWVIPTTGEKAGEAYPFAIGPMDTEICGLCLTPDQQNLFLAIQHPGEVGGTRQNLATEERQLAMRTSSGVEFMQKRQVPIGSNWPGKENEPPRPAVVIVNFPT
ncbi:MAG: DUF839 domain-containing protein [Gomphosphaeria aponina SAG 52.96 = DSM 107014]|uniref:DUF839 domain-containing protein n=1 Tax=Gomphosphaeria aponina SAG 52.96 = DSM 107014 TaxID=1521640 RepID=A0A941GTQ9_9CHRO|nr:DUF839 domain-containing protein [Gomphosphaeria aponina SAG 52.96 = DSM 107014]